MIIRSSERNQGHPPPFQRPAGKVARQRSRPKAAGRQANDCILAPAEIEQFHKDWFLFIDRPVLELKDVVEVRRVADHLFALWDQIPRRLAPEAPKGAPAVLEIKYSMALAPQLRHVGLFAACRRLARELLGSKQTWCHFDHLIYKHPGAEAIAWHQDLAASRAGLFKTSVHFWVPLQDVTIRDGSLMFVPGSHKHGLLGHVAQHRVGGVQLKVDRLPGGLGYVAKALPIGGFSVHTPETLHASAANVGAGLRRAWILQFGAGPASYATASLVNASSLLLAKPRSRG